MDMAKGIIPKNTSSMEALYFELCNTQCTLFFRVCPCHHDEVAQRAGARGCLLPMEENTARILANNRVSVALISGLCCHLYRSCCRL